MSISNLVWAVTIGDYALRINRKTLTYSLMETQTGTVWADNLPVGWIELTDRATGDVTRHDFGAAQLISLSEKSGAQGKRILFGLDMLGVPVDLYFTCSPKEIQLTVEASRDTRGYRVGTICLLPGLGLQPANIPAEMVGLNIAWSRTARPHWQFTAAQSTDTYDSNNGNNEVVDIGDSDDGTTKPLLVILLDSLYAAEEETYNNAGFVYGFHFHRDPERRRLDLRLILVPQGNSLTSALTYREKLITQNEHITVRRKMRDNPALENLIGAALVRFAPPRQGVPVSSLSQCVAMATDLRNALGVERALCFLPCKATEQPPPNFREAVTCLHELGYQVGVEWPHRDPTLPEAWMEQGLDTVLLLAFQKRAILPDVNLWEELETNITALSTLHERGLLIGTRDSDPWLAPFCDWSVAKTVAQNAVLFHDALVPFYYTPMHARRYSTDWLESLLYATLPHYELHATGYFAPDSRQQGNIRLTYPTSSALYQQMIGAFLKGQRKLHREARKGAMRTNIYETTWSNGARILINVNRRNSYTVDGITLPPLGYHAKVGETVWQGVAPHYL